EANTVIREAERRDTSLEAAVVDALDGIESGRVDTLDRAGDNRLRGGALVGVNADAVDTLRLRRRQDAEATATGHLEEHIRASGDLRIGFVGALCGIGEVVRIGNEDLRGRILHLHGPLEASDVVIDGWNLHATDRTDLMRLLGRLALFFQ